MAIIDMVRPHGEFVAIHLVVHRDWSFRGCCLDMPRCFIGFEPDTRLSRLTDRKRLHVARIFAYEVRAWRPDRHLQIDGQRRCGDGNGDVDEMRATLWQRNVIVDCVHAVYGANK
jgi:hypothetical protein